jgi:carbon monoxide dehydrogenase subunit G
MLAWDWRVHVIEDSFSVRINRSPEQVFAVLTDFEQYLARWAKGPIAARRLTAEAGIGSRFTVTAKVGPFKVSSPYEVTLWEPPQRFGGLGIAGPVAFDERYILNPTDAGTELTQSMSARPRGPFRLIESLVRRQLSTLITGDLERLRVLVETET